MSSRSSMLRYYCQSPDRGAAFPSTDPSTVQRDARKSCGAQTIISLCLFLSGMVQNAQTPSRRCYPARYSSLTGSGPPVEGKIAFVPPGWLYLCDDELIHEQADPAVTLPSICSIARCVNTTGTPEDCRHWNRTSPRFISRFVIAVVGFSSAARCTNVIRGDDSLFKESWPKLLLDHNGQNPSTVKRWINCQAAIELRGKWLRRMKRDVFRSFLETELLRASSRKNVIIALQIIISASLAGPTPLMETKSKDWYPNNPHIRMLFFYSFRHDAIWRNRIGQRFRARRQHHKLLVLWRKLHPPLSAVRYLYSAMQSVCRHSSGNNTWKDRRKNDNKS